MKRALRVMCLAFGIAGAACGQPPDAGEVTNLPAGLLLADLPDGASVRRLHGADFDVDFIDRDDRPHVGIYLGNDPRFPGHQPGEDEVEQRAVVEGVTTVSVTRERVLVSCGKLFDGRSKESDDPTHGDGISAAPATEAPRAITARPPLSELQARLGWCETVHAFTVPVVSEDPSGQRVLEAVPEEALALLQSVAIGPELRASWAESR